MKRGDRVYCGQTARTQRYGLGLVAKLQRGEALTAAEEAWLALPAPHASSETRAQRLGLELEAAIPKDAKC